MHGSRKCRSLPRTAALRPPSGWRGRVSAVTRVAIKAHQTQELEKAEAKLARAREILGWLARSIRSRGMTAMAENATNLRATLDEDDLRLILVEQRKLFWRVFSEIRSTREGPYYDRFMVEDMPEWLNEEIPKRLLVPQCALRCRAGVTAMAENTALPDPHAHAQALIRANPRANPDELLELWNQWYRNDANLRLAVLEGVPTAFLAQAATPPSADLADFLPPSSNGRSVFVSMTCRSSTGHGAEPGPACRANASSRTTGTSSMRNRAGEGEGGLPGHAAARHRP
jgi:hypothetical protein